VSAVCLDSIFYPTWYVCRGFHPSFPSFFTLRGLMSPLRHHPMILLHQLPAVVFLSRANSWWKPVWRRSCVHLLSFVFHTTHLSLPRRVSSESCLSWSSMVSHRYTVLEFPVPHQHSSSLEGEGKKTGDTTAGGSWTLWSFHICFMTRRRCLVGVNTFTSSRLSWVLHEVWILARVSGVDPQTFRRWFHVPLMMVHPILAECVMVVSPSWVTTEDPSIFSRQSNDFCCSWIHPKSFSP
jgi:hypothetical protein